MCLSGIYAQEHTLDETPGINYFIDFSGDEPRFFQRLIWEEAEYVFRYEVFIERLEGEDFYEVERFSVEKNFAEVSLAAGRYRYRLDVYDLVDALSYSAEWREFSVILALQPELTDFSPHAFWLDEDDVWVINLHGQNLLPDSEFYLVQDNVRITPHSHTANGTSARLEFSGGSLYPGEYSLYVINPGGLDVNFGRFFIGNRTPFDINVSLGYAPIIPLYGYLFNDTDLDAPFPGLLYPMSAVVKINFIPIKRFWGNAGVELSGSFTALEHAREFYSANAYLLNVHLGFLYQKYFQRRMFVFNAGIGAGITSLLNFQYHYPVGSPTETITGHYPSVGVGLSLSFFFFKHFYVNAAVDAIHVFTPSEDRPMPGFFRPLITMGLLL